MRFSALRSVSYIVLSANFVKLTSSHCLQTRVIIAFLVLIKDMGLCDESVDTEIYRS